jgi:GNAT superfamily N-acetyltransferase
MPIDFVYECICVEPPTGGQVHSPGCVFTNRLRAELQAIEAGDTEPPLIATLPDDSVRAWDEIARTHPKDGPPGLHHEEVHVAPGSDPRTRTGWSGGTVHVLTHRNSRGRLTGVLYYYPDEFHGVDRGVVAVQRAGSVNMWVDPARQGRGIGTALVMEGNRLWPEIDLSGLDLTEGGAAMARRVAEVRRQTARTPG